MENIKKAYIASTNQVKVNALKEVLSDYEIISIKVDSGVSNQPKSDEETILGAINRAKALPGDGLRFGLEAGVTRQFGKLYLVNFGALIDKNNNIYTAGGTRIELPKVIEDKIFNEGKELALIMEELFQEKDVRSHQGAIGIFTSNMVKRIDIFTHIIKLLYGQYLYKESQK